MSSDTVAPAGAAQEAGLSGALTLLMAAACGLMVANIYYNQPLLGLLIRDFGGPGVVSFVPTATQLGYAIGILALVPLGDRMDRRRLIVAQTLLLALALLLAAVAPGPAVLAVASVLIGILATVPQQIIPFAADLAAPARRGQAIGKVMSGLLCGILLARTVSGFVGEAFGWRAVFGLGIAVALVTAGVLAAALPSRTPATGLSYGRLLASVGRLAREEPRLRVAAVTQAFLFASFSIFWTILALRLEQPPYRMGADVAGLFGLVGVAGALAAPLAGRIADRRGPRFGVGVCIGLTLLAWVAFAASDSLVALVIGVVLLDAGVQGALIGNQHIIFALRPEARNRLNSVFMGAIFLGGSAGSALGVSAWHAGGWTAVCLLSTGFVVAGLLVHVLAGPGPSARDHAGA